MRVTRFLSKVVRVAAGLAVLAWGSTAAPAQGKRVVSFEGARPSFEACLSARAAIRSASDLLRTKDPDYRSHLDTARSGVDASLAASAQAVWPAELLRRQRNVGRYLSAAAMRITRSEASAIAARLGRVALQVHLARRNLTKAALLLDDVVPPPKPGLSDTPVDTPPEINPPSEFVWTDLSPSADSRVIYVSSSDGDNANDGLSPEHPKATWWGSDGAGSLMRPQYPDWMLLKRGDVWTEHIDDHQLRLDGGRSKSEPMVLSYYGSSTERPKIQCTQILTYGGGEHSHVCIIGIHLERLASTPLPYNPSNYNYPIAIAITPNHGSDILIEDCFIEKYAAAMQIQPLDEAQRISDVRIRGCVVVDSYETGGVHAQGIFMSNVDGILIEACVLDHNGWNEAIPGAGMTIFNHNVYITGSCTEFTFRQNITARASANGMPGGICKLNEQNLYLSNPFGCNAYNSAEASTIRYNVFIDGANVRGPNMDGGDGSQGGGTGMFMSFNTGPAYAGHTVEVYENILANQTTGTGPTGLSIDGAINGLSIHDNILYKWNGSLYPSDRATVSGTNDVTNNIFEIGSADNGVLYTSAALAPIDVGWRFSGNTWYSAASTPWWVVKYGWVYSPDDWTAKSGETGGAYTQPSFPDPTRTAGSYNALLGGTATLDAFLTEARKQSRANWRPAYTARQAINYFRAGFGRDPR